MRIYIEIYLYIYSIINLTSITAQAQTRFHTHKFYLKFIFFDLKFYTIIIRKKM